MHAQIRTPTITQFINLNNLEMNIINPQEQESKS
jgi:hypothetical protein